MFSPASPRSQSGARYQNYATLSGASGSGLARGSGSGPAKVPKKKKGTFTSINSTTVFTEAYYKEKEEQAAAFRKRIRPRYNIPEEDILQAQKYVEENALRKQITSNTDVSQIPTTTLPAKNRTSAYSFDIFKKRSEYQQKYMFGKVWSRKPSILTRIPEAKEPIITASNHLVPTENFVSIPIGATSHAFPPQKRYFTTKAKNLEPYFEKNLAVF